MRMIVSSSQLKSNNAQERRQRRKEEESYYTHEIEKREVAAVEADTSEKDYVIESMTETIKELEYLLMLHAVNNEDRGLKKLLKEFVIKHNKNLKMKWEKLFFQE